MYSHSGQHALHHRWCSLCCCQSSHWISSRQVQKKMMLKWTNCAQFMRLGNIKVASTKWRCLTFHNMENPIENYPGFSSPPCACSGELPQLGLDLSFLLHHLLFSAHLWLRFYQKHIELHVLFIAFLSSRSVWVLDCTVLECLLVSSPLSPL